MKIYPFLCRNASFYYMFCADRTDRHKTRKPSKKVLPTWLEHIHHPMSYIHAEERPRISRSVRRAHRTGLPADSRPAETGNILANGHSHMVPSRQRTLSIPAPYRCHALAMFVRRPKQQAPKAPTQKIAAHEKTAPSDDGAVSHTSYPRSAMIDPAAVHHTRSCAAKPIHASPHLSARHHTHFLPFPSRLQCLSIHVPGALHTGSVSIPYLRHLSAKTPPRRNERPSAHRAEGLFGVGIYLLSRAASSQVSSTRVSLTAVFGMGTGVPSPSSTPTICGSPPPISSLALRKVIP